MAATDLVLPSLRQAWDALPDVPLIPNYGEDLVVFGKKVEIAHYSKYNSSDILEALQTLIPSKHSLVLIPSFGGTPVFIPQMTKEALRSSACLSSKMETSAIIDGEFLEGFEVLSNRMDHEDQGEAMDAREMADDMLFERTLVKISAGSVKFFVFYFDESVNALVFLIGNRKVVSFDQTRIRTILNRVKKARLAAEKEQQKPVEVSQRKKKRVISSSSSEEESESSSDSSSSDEDNGGGSTPVFNPHLLASQTCFPVDPMLQSYSTLPVVKDYAQSQAFNKAKADADLMLAQAQERVAVLSAQALVYESSKPTVPASPMASVNGPALKPVGVPPISIPGYMIPKKSSPVGVSFKQSSKKPKHKRSKKDKKRHSKSGDKKMKHSRRVKKSSKKSRKYESSSAASVSSMSESDVSENEEQKQV